MIYRMICVLLAGRLIPRKAHISQRRRLQYQCLVNVKTSLSCASICSSLSLVLLFVTTSTSTVSRPTPHPITTRYASCHPEKYSHNMPLVPAEVGPPTRPQDSKQIPHTVVEGFWKTPSTNRQPRYVPLTASSTEAYAAFSARPSLHPHVQHYDFQHDVSLLVPSVRVVGST